MKFNPRNIIVRMPNWVGDLVMATPILKDLRNHWPEAKITAFCQGSLGSLIQEDPHINQIITVKKPKGLFSRQAREEIVEPLKKEQYDLGLLLTNSFSSAWRFWQGNVQNRIGYPKHGRRFLLTHPIPFPPNYQNQHLVVTFKMLLLPFGVPVSNTPPQLYITDQEKANAKLPVSSDSIIVGINPGAAYGSAKCWLPDRFKSVTHRLLDNPKVTVVYFGDKGGAPLVNEICAGLGERVINLAGKTTMRELMAYIQQCHLFLTNDSGPMHMASALGIQLVALFGSTSDVATGPYSGGRVIHKHVPCSPCYRRECPIDFRCMTRIGVDEVYRELQMIIHKYEHK